jgi:hypothetical protein
MIRHYATYADIGISRIRGVPQRMAARHGR